jgi:flagella basal body P-ring formation protein FlgA
VIDFINTLIVTGFIIASSFGSPGIANAAAEPAPSTISLRGSAVVSGPDLLLGDIFAGAGDKARTRIGATPAAGTPLTLDAQTLSRLASLHGLNWRPSSPQDRAIVERDAVAVTSQDLEAQLLMALAQQGVATDGLDIDLALSQRQLYRPRESQIVVDGVTTDPTARRFSGVLAIIAPGQPRQTLPVSGRLTQSLRVPVLTRPLRPGELVAATAVTWAAVPERQVPANAVRELTGLVGFSARRALPAGVPVLVSDLRPAKLVAKGQVVTLMFSQPGLHLTARGVALQDGADGDTIRVANERSRTTLDGVVTSTGAIAIGPATYAQR